MSQTFSSASVVIGALRVMARLNLDIRVLMKSSRIQKYTVNKEIDIVYVKWAKIVPCKFRDDF